MLLLVAVAACSEKNVAATARSPDGKLEAVHVETFSGGATVGTFDDVYVQTTAKKSQKVNVISGYELGCVALSWMAARHLGIKYSPMSKASIGALPKDSIFSLAT